MSFIKIGLVGCGAWGKFILRDLVSLGCEVHVVARSKTACDNAATYGAFKIVKNVSDLDTDLEGCVVATTTETHFEVIQELLFLKIPLFVEKPLCPSLRQAELLAEVETPIFIMHKWRYHDGIVELANIRLSGDLGQIRSIKCQRGEWGVAHQDVDATWILLPHDLSIMAHILGEFPSPIYASGFKRKEAARDGSDYFLQMRGELKAAFCHSSFEVSFRDPLCRREVTVLFDDGAVSLEDPLADHLILRKTPMAGQKGAVTQKLPIDTEFPLKKELRSFVNYLNGGEPPLSSLEFELGLINIIDQLRRLSA